MHPQGLGPGIVPKYNFIAHAMTGILGLIPKNIIIIAPIRTGALGLVPKNIIIIIAPARTGGPGLV